jgi:phosphonate transport system substrate-binding protein
MNRLLLGLSLVAVTHAVAAKQNVVLGVSGRPVDAVVRHLNASPEIAVQVKTFATDDLLYDALRDGQVDLAFLGAVRYVQARYEFGATPLVADGKASRSIIAVPIASPITSVKQLRGKRFAFGYEESTSTYLIPLLLLSKNGLKPEDVQGSFVSHRPQDLVDQMLAGKFDACAVSERTLLSNKSKVRVLESSEPFAGPPLVARKGFAAGLAAELRRLMASYQPPANGPSERFSDGVVLVSDSDYNRIRFLCKVVLKKSYL